MLIKYSQVLTTSSWELKSLASTVEVLDKALEHRKVMSYVTAGNVVVYPAPGGMTILAHATNYLVGIIDSSLWEALKKFVIFIVN